MIQTQFNSNEKLWSGIPLPPLYNPKVSLGRVLLRAMELHPTRIGQISANNNVEMTYGEMYIKTIRAAQNIQAWNYKKGDVFGIVSTNNHNMMPLIVGLLCLDHPITPIPSVFTEFEMNHMLNMTKPKVVFSDKESYDIVKKCLIQLKNDARIYIFGGSIDEDIFDATGREDEFIPVDVDGEKDIAGILFSSGTSGPSKAVSLTHAIILENLSQSYKTTENDIIFTFNSPSCLGGWMMLLRSILYSATSVITTEDSSPKLLLQIIEKYKVTVVLSATFHWLMMLKGDELPRADLSSVKYCNTIGSKLPIEASRAINSYLPNGQVIVRYGMTETCGTVAINFLRSRTDTVGQLVSGCQVKIVDEAGERLGIGEDGEVCIKCTYKFAGYYGDQEGTDALFDAEGFIRSGDIGHFDENGFLYIVDRKKDLLICGQSKISPSRIEGFLMENSGIKSVCVVGIDDGVLNELPAAVVVRSNSSNITAQQVYDLVAGEFREHWKLRGGVYFVDSLPMTTTGKFVRRKVKMIATELRKQEQLQMDKV